MPTIGRTLAVVALSLTAATAIGCSSSSPEGDGGTSRSTVADAHDQGVAFARCMRQNGVPDFPDPGPDGELTIDELANDSSIDPSSAAFERASSACEDLAPTGFTGEERTEDEQEQALDFARCMREHGVPDFPDPTPGSPLVDTNQIPSSNSAGGMDRLDAAMATCGDIIEDLVGGS